MPFEGVDPIVVRPACRNCESGKYRAKTDIVPVPLRPAPNAFDAPSSNASALPNQFAGPSAKSRITPAVPAV
jgi:hypothetical protein